MSQIRKQVAENSERVGGIDACLRNTDGIVSAATPGASCAGTGEVGCVKLTGGKTEFESGAGRKPMKTMARSGPRTPIILGNGGTLGACRR